MSPDQRRQTIINAALPLLAEYGAAVTTGQIARAAGIGEGTIFRVFDDKTAVLEACVTAAMDPTHVLTELRSIPLDQPLADRLIEAGDALDAHLTRMGTVIAALHASGQPHLRHRDARRDDPAGAAPQSRSTGRDSSQAAVRETIGELLEPDRELLRVPAETVIDAFLRLQFARTAEASRPVDRRQLVDLLLHGAVLPAEAP